jgi:glycerophosphoryl diester phosphodiesterase
VASRPSPADSFLSPPRPRLLAHRGLALEAPENTLLAFAKAIALGAAYVETDVHASADGVAVIVHDPDLDRVAGRDARVEDFTLEQLRAVDLGAGQQVPTLAEALDGFPETRFNIDIKSAAAAEPAAQVIRDLGAVDRVLVTSFDELRRPRAVRGLPGVASSASSSRFAVALVAGKVGLVPLMRLALRGLVAVQVPEEAAGLRIATPTMIARLHRAGVEVHFWTVNDPARMLELVAMGADGIVTDRFDLAVDAFGRPD